MSAKRRQEAIARFSVPLERSSTFETIEGKAARHSRKTRNASLVESDGTDWDDGNDGDFEMHDNSEDDLDGLGSSSLPKRSKTKGKGKAIQNEFDPSDQNPRIMLLSLKAVRCIVRLRQIALNILRRELLD